MFENLKDSIAQIQSLDIPEDRKGTLHMLADYCQGRLDSGEELRLNFICTHNSRRSQFSQVWAQVASSFYGIPASCHSGGVEVTAFNERAIASLLRTGFQITSNGETNPDYSICFSEADSPILGFSKLYDHPSSPQKGFAAIMTCSDADENCPFIPGTDARIPLRYEDPKAFDDTPEEEARYDERSFQIASELFYVFNRLAKDS